MSGDTPHERPVVAILKASYGSAEAQIREALRLVGHERQRKRLLLKPSVFTSARWLPTGGVPHAAHTDVRFLKALLRAFAGYEIPIAESGAAHYDTEAPLEKAGIASLARQYEAQVVRLGHVERVEVGWRYGTLRVPALLRTHEDSSVPKLRTHIPAGVTLGCKSQKGLPEGHARVVCHRDCTRELWTPAWPVRWKTSRKPAQGNGRVTSRVPDVCRASGSRRIAQTGISFWPRHFAP